MWFLVFVIDLGLVGLCLEGDGLGTGNSNIKKVIYIYGHAYMLTMQIR